MTEIVYVALVAASYRLLFACLTRTTFVPDEYFQLVEPAYALAWGRSVQYVGL